MPIRWSAVKVSVAMDMIEQQVLNAVPHLEKARELAGKAKGIENVPQYITQDLDRLILEINRAIGGSHLEPIGRFRAAIKSVRESIPKGAIEAEQGITKHGSQQSLM
jgi:hypothetical protein